MKLATACPQCRSTKRKCAQDPLDPQAACLACKNRGIKCSTPWKQPKTNRPKVRLAPSTTTESRDKAQIALPEDINDFVRLYFRYIHDRPHSLFHEPSIWAALTNDTLSEGLTAAICALGCRFAAHTNQRELATVFMARSKTVLGQQLEDMSITNIQTCVLLANSYAAEQNNRLEALYFGKSTTFYSTSRNPNST